MDEITANDAPEVDEDHKVRLLQAQSSQRHPAATWLHCACSPDDVRNQTFAYVLKCAFVILLLLSLLSNVLLVSLPEGDLPKSGVRWNLLTDLTRSPVTTGWKTSVLIIVFVAVIYVGRFLMKLRKTTGSASRREVDVPTISASIQV